MNNMAELITVAKYWQQWTDPRLVVAVLHNNDLNQVTWEMRAMGDSPQFASSQTLPDVDSPPLPAASVYQAKTSTMQTSWAVRGSARWQRTGRRCLTSGVIPTCRRFHPRDVRAGEVGRQGGAGRRRGPPVSSSRESSRKRSNTCPDVRIHEWPCRRRRMKER